MEAAEYKAAANKPGQRKCSRQSCETAINMLPCICFSLCAHINAWFNNYNGSTDYSVLSVTTHISLFTFSLCSFMIIMFLYFRRSDFELHFYIFHIWSLITLHYITLTLHQFINNRVRIFLKWLFCFLVFVANSYWDRNFLSFFLNPDPYVT